MEYDHLRRGKRRGPWRKFVIFCLGLGIVLSLIFFWRIASFSQEQEREEQANLEPAPEQFPAIHGIMVGKEVASRRPVSVMVENHPDSRPQSGLSKADVVYEALAEGGITRFLALFQTSDVSSIGPVRSARDYYAELANSWGAAYAHVGGSPEVLENIRQGEYKNILDINEYFNGAYFERKKSRFAPHNVYTSTSSLHNFLQEKAALTWQSRQWFRFVQEETAASISAQTVAVEFSTSSFSVRYEYDPGHKTYNRFIAGTKDIDADSNTHISPKTVIVQMVKVTDVPNDPALRVNIDLASGGDALVFSNGTVTEGLWKKEGDGKISYVDTTGNEIPVSPGQIWVELVPSTKRASVVWKPALEAHTGDAL